MCIYIIHTHTIKTHICIMVKKHEENTHWKNAYLVLRKCTKRLTAIVSGNLSILYIFCSLYFCNWEGLQSPASLEVQCGYMPEFCHLKWEWKWFTLSLPHNLCSHTIYALFPHLLVGQWEVNLGALCWKGRDS